MHEARLPLLLADLNFHVRVATCCPLPTPKTLECVQNHQSGHRDRSFPSLRIVMHFANQKRRTNRVEKLYSSTHTVIRRAKDKDKDKGYGNGNGNGNGNRNGNGNGNGKGNDNGHGNGNGHDNGSGNGQPNPESSHTESPIGTEDVSQTVIPPTNIVSDAPIPSQPASLPMVSPTSLPTPGPLSPIDSQSTISLMSRHLGESGSVASTDILPSIETEHTTSLALSDAITRHSTPQPSVPLSQVIPSSSSGVNHVSNGCRFSSVIAKPHERWTLG